jgi:hypothetical protein
MHDDDPKSLSFDSPSTWELQGIKHFPEKGDRTELLLSNRVLGELTFAVSYRKPEGPYYVFQLHDPKAHITYARLETGGTHPNPTSEPPEIGLVPFRGLRINEPHLHLYYPNEGVTWAIPLSFTDFFEINTARFLMEKIVDYLAIKGETPLSWGLFDDRFLNLVERATIKRDIGILPDFAERRLRSSDDTFL